MQTEIGRLDMLLILIAATLYLIFLLGIWMIYLERMKCSWAKIMMHNRLKARRKALKPETVMERHLRKVLSITLKKPMNPKTFLRYTGTLFSLILLAGIQTVSALSAVLMAALISLMPYLMLRVRVETIRRKSSYEGEKLIAEFLCQYRISGLNIYKTIEQVILASEGLKIYRKAAVQAPAGTKKYWKFAGD